jgi:uncharacterized repeat protein (TIGR03803 family)
LLSATVSTLFSFNSSVDASAITVDDSGNVFGTSVYGGNTSLNNGSGWGMIWELPKGSTKISTLYSFTDGPHDGAFPLGIAVDGDGNLYGTTLDGGYASPSAGSVWELPNNSGTLTTLYNFPTFPVNGDFLSPYAIAIDNNGDLYGTENNAGSSVSNGEEVGSVWELPRGSNNVTTLYSDSGNVYLSGIAVDNTGNVYVTDEGGGNDNGGSLFELTGGTSDASTLYSFAGSVAGANPAALTIDGHGNLYGTTNNPGGAWELSAASRTFTPLGVVGAYVSIGTDGNLYGTQPGGGASNDGDINELTIAASSALGSKIAHSSIPAAAIASSSLKGSAVIDVTNSAAVVSTGQTTVSLYASADGLVDSASVLLGSVTRSRLKIRAGSTITISTPIAATAPHVNGTYALYAQVASPTGATNVSAAGPGLIVANPFIEPAVTVGAVAPARIAATKSASVSVTVANTGNIVAAGVDIALNPSTDGLSPIASTVLASIQSRAKIQPGKSKTFKLHFRVTTALIAGSYFPYVTVSLGSVSTTSAGTEEFVVV